MRRLGWFLVGATSAAGALVAAPRVYERLRGAIGAGDPWTEFESEDRQWGVLREAPPIETEPEPWVADAAAHEPAVAAPEPDPEDTAVLTPEPPVAEAPGQEAPVGAAVAEPEAAPAAEAEPEQDDDTGEITPVPLTAAPPPEDSTASELRNRIQTSRARLRRKAKAAGDDDEGDAPGESDQPDGPDSSA